MGLRVPRAVAATVMLAMMMGITACESTPEVVNEYPEGRRPGQTAPYPTAPNANDTKDQSVFGPGGLSMGFGGEDNGGGGGGDGSGIGVNGFLWRASLDTIAFMPVNAADPFGGVIITDWHALPEAPGERFKMNVYILGRTLRADGIRVAVFRQVQDGSGGWQDAAVPADSSARIENAILTRARQLRFDVLSQ